MSRSNVYSRIKNCYVQLHVLYMERLIHCFSPKHEWKKVKIVSFLSQWLTQNQHKNSYRILIPTVNRGWTVRMMWWKACLCHSLTQSNSGAGSSSSVCSSWALYADQRGKKNSNSKPPSPSSCQHKFILHSKILMAPCSLVLSFKHCIHPCTRET